MFYQKIFNTEGDGNQHDDTLFSFSMEFLEAARILQATPPVRIGYSSATYYLLGHSAELMLKAFLYKHDQPISDLRKINHNLEKLASCVRKVGLSKKVQMDQILNLAAAYREKSLEYRTNKRKTFPSLDLLIEEIEVSRNQYAREMENLTLRSE